LNFEISDKLVVDKHFFMCMFVLHVRISIWLNGFNGMSSHVAGSLAIMCFLQPLLNFVDYGMSACALKHFSYITLPFYQCQCQVAGASKTAVQSSCRCMCKQHASNLGIPFPEIVTFMNRVIVAYCRCCWSSGWSAILGEWVNATSGRTGKVKIHINCNLHLGAL